MEDISNSVAEEQKISLDNLFNEKGALAWKPSQVNGLVVGEFKITGVISDFGGHGLVVSCVDEMNTSYAMKLERKESSMVSDNTALRQFWGHSSIQQIPIESIHVPKLRETLKINKKEVTVMELLGPDLFTLRAAAGAFSLKTTMQIALSILTAYEQIHQTGWLHLSTKPLNFCIGGTPETRHKIYAVDFGRAESYLVSGTAQHREMKKGVRTAGHFEFSSVWTDAERTPSRRDELMSLILMLMSLGGCMAPWNQVGNKKLTWLKWIKESHTRTLYEEMVLVAWYLDYEEAIPYEKLKEVIRSYAQKRGIELDGKFDWDESIHVNENGRIVMKVNPTIYIVSA